MEHSYALSCDDSSNTSNSDARLLLVRKPPLCPQCHNTESNDDDNIIDVTTVDNEPTPPLLLDDIPPLEKYDVTQDNNDDVVHDDDTSWEHTMYNIAWDHNQLMMIQETLHIIYSTRLALLGCYTKGTKRAACRGIAARSMRALLASNTVRWQSRLVQWLHNTMTENLPSPLLAVYTDILLTLKTKIPSLIDKMTLGHPLTGRIRGATDHHDSGGPTIASASNPTISSTSPYLLLIPSGRDKKDARWAERLRNTLQSYQVYQVHSHQSNWPTTLPIPACLSQLVGSGRSRANSLKAENPHRPLVLVGHNAGASIAIQLATTISDVAGVVCLGLPLLTSDGPRGSPEDCLLDVTCPILFVVGQNANNSSQEDIEFLRSKLRCKSKLLVVGGADDHLRVPRLRRHLEGVTQRMVERAIADEVGNFLSSLSQWEEEGDGRSTPDSVIDEQEPERLLPTTTIPTNIPVKRRFPETSLYQKTKKFRHKPIIKSTSPLKGRGVALYQVNNPPPEGTKISMGQLLSTKVGDEDFLPDSGNGLSPSSVKPENASSLHVQITNNRLTKTIPLGGNGSSKERIGNSGIKVLENIPFKMTKMGNTRLVGSLSSPANTPIILPRKSAPANLIKSAEPPTCSSINSTNIMNIPIIFADDDSALGEKQNQQPTIIPQITSMSNMKTLILNKSQIGQSATNILKVRASPATIQTATTLQNRITMNPSTTLKYTKVIMPSQGVVKPIFVTKKGTPLTTIKVFPGSVFQKGGPGNNKQLVLKRASTPGSMSVLSGSLTPMDATRKKTELILHNSNSDKAIEAAVASITDDKDTL